MNGLIRAYRGLLQCVFKRTSDGDWGNVWKVWQDGR